MKFLLPGLRQITLNVENKRTQLEAEGWELKWASSSVILIFEKPGEKSRIFTTSGGGGLLPPSVRERDFIVLAEKDGENAYHLGDELCPFLSGSANELAWLGGWHRAKLAAQVLAATEDVDTRMRGHDDNL